MNRQLTPLFILGAFVLHGCGGGTTTPPAVGVNFSTAPPASLSIGVGVPLAVTVSNDSSNAGVTFSCTPAGSCGTFTAVTPMSATYNAPGAIPAGGSVIVTAKSVSDPTKTADATVTITGPNISVAISQQPPASLQVGGTASVTATITNDPAGIDWSCTPIGACGSFSPTNTASSVPTTYTAPGVIPAGSQVTLTASSHSDPTKKAPTNAITITGVASLASLKGQYAFLVLSPTGSRGTAAWAGSVNLDGAGGLAVVGATTFAGAEDVVSPVRNDQGDNIYPTTSNPASLYTVDASGHGRLTMATVNGELLGISFVVTSTNSSGIATHAEIIEADGTGGDAGDPGSGTMDMQTPSDFANFPLSSAYSVILSGVNASSPYPPITLGGIFTFNRANVPISVSGTIDTGSTANSVGFAGGSIDSAPDANGRGRFHIVPANPEPQRAFAYYVVNAKVIRIFESGAVSYVGGSMYSQGAATTTLSGTYVYQHSGWSIAGRTVAAGQFNVASGSGNFSGGIIGC
jgi:hypothetical protein